MGGVLKFFIQNDYFVGLWVAARPVKVIEPTTERMGKCRDVCQQESRLSRPVVTKPPRTCEHWSLANSYHLGQHFVAKLSDKCWHAFAPSVCFPSPISIFVCDKNDIFFNTRIKWFIKIKYSQSEVLLILFDTCIV